MCKFENVQIRKYVPDWFEGVRNKNFKIAETQFAYLHICTSSH